MIVTTAWEMNNCNVCPPSPSVSLCVVQSTLTPFISVTLCFDVFGVNFLSHTSPTHARQWRLATPRILYNLYVRCACGIPRAEVRKCGSGSGFRGCAAKAAWRRIEMGHAARGMLHTQTRSCRHTLKPQHAHTQPDRARTHTTHNSVLTLTLRM